MLSCHASCGCHESRQFRPLRGNGLNEISARLEVLVGVFDMARFLKGRCRRSLTVCRLPLRHFLQGFNSRYRGAFYFRRRKRMGHASDSGYL